MEIIQDFELKQLKIALVDLVAPYSTGNRNIYLPTMYIYEERLRDLQGLSKEEQKKELETIAHKVVFGSTKGKIYGG